MTGSRKGLYASVVGRGDISSKNFSADEMVSVIEAIADSEYNSNYATFHGKMGVAEVEDQPALVIADDRGAAFWGELKVASPKNTLQDDSAVHHFLTSDERFSILPIHKELFAYGWRAVNAYSSDEVTDSDKQTLFDNAYKAAYESLNQKIAKHLEAVEAWLKEHPETYQDDKKKNAFIKKSLNEFLDEQRPVIAKKIEAHVADALARNRQLAGSETIKQRLKQETPSDSTVIESNRVLGLITRTDGTKASQQAKGQVEHSRTRIRKYAMNGENTGQCIQDFYRAASIEETTVDGTPKSVEAIIREEVEERVVNRELRAKDARKNTDIDAVNKKNVTDNGTPRASFNIGDDADVLENSIEGDRDSVSTVAWGRASALRYEPLGGGDTQVDMRPPVIHNLMTSIPIGNTIRDDNKQAKTLKANLAAMHAYNKKREKQPFFFFMNVPVNQRSYKLSYESPSALAREAMLASDLAVLTSVLSEVIKIGPEGNRTPVGQHLQGLYQQALDQKAGGYLHQSPAGRKLVAECKRLKKILRQHVYNPQTEEQVSAKTSEQKLRAVFAKLYAKKFGSGANVGKENTDWLGLKRAGSLAKSGAYWAMRQMGLNWGQQLQYGKMTQAMHMALNRFDQNAGCKSAVDRFTVVETADDLLLAYAQNTLPDGDLKAEVNTLMEGYLQNTVNSKQLTVGLDKLVSKYAAYSPATTAGILAAGAHKAEARKAVSADRGDLARVTDSTNVVYSAAYQDTVKQSKASKVQSHKSAERMLEIAEQARANHPNALSASEWKHEEGDFAGWKIYEGGNEDIDVGTGTSTSDGAETEKHRNQVFRGDQADHQVVADPKGKLPPDRDSVADIGGIEAAQSSRSSGLSS